MKTHLEKLEDELKKIWKTHAGNSTKNGAHTEIEIEPRAFVGDGLNPELANLLATVYLSHTTIEDVKHGKVEIADHTLVIKGEDKKPIAIIRSRKAIKEFKGRMGL